ncbi:MAG: hypothetical protein ACK2UI_06920 [Anaerolineae bacterium]
MTRRRRTSYRRSRSSSRSDKRMRGAERILFIVGATLYVIGLFGGLSMLDMPTMTATMLLALGGGMLLALALMFVF